MCHSAPWCLGFAASSPKNRLFLVEQPRAWGKQNWLLKSSGAVARREQDWPRDGSSLSGKARDGSASIPESGRQMLPECLVPYSGTFAEYKQSYFRTILLELFRSEVISCEVKQRRAAP